MSRKIEGLVLGFDAREIFVDPKTMWSQERALQFLLRPLESRPLSVDPFVWPSMFGTGLSRADRNSLGLDDLRIPAWRGRTAELWEDLGQMRAALVDIDPSTYRIVAVSDASKVVVSTDNDLATRSSQPNSTAPNILDSNWDMLGYDIADADLISGLSDCGYKETERDELRAVWSMKLNDHHLFLDRKQADAFRAFTDLRVPEHAPFFVYVLSVLKPSRR